MSKNDSLDIDKKSNLSVITDTQNRFITTNSVLVEIARDSSKVVFKKNKSIAWVDILANKNNNYRILNKVNSFNFTLLIALASVVLSCIYLSITLPYNLYLFESPDGDINCSVTSHEDGSAGAYQENIEICRELNEYSMREVVK